MKTIFLYNCFSSFASLDPSQDMFNCSTTRQFDYTLQISKMQLSFVNIFLKQLFSWNYDKKQFKKPFFQPHI